MFCIKTYVSIVSANIKPVGLPYGDSHTFENYAAQVSGFGVTVPGKSVDPFNSYSTDKKLLLLLLLLLYSQCHVDLFEVTQQYII
jgi:hypothetical protein